MIPTLLKEWRLLVRDRAGLLVLFLMPALLVVVVSLVQMNVLASVSAQPTTVLLVNRDEGALGGMLKAALAEAGYIQPVEILTGTALTEETGRSAVTDGTYQVCLVVPSGLTTRVRRNARREAEDILQGRVRPADGQSETLSLGLYFDPLAGGAFRAALTLAVGNVLLGIEMRERMAALTQLLPGTVSEALEDRVGPPVADGVRAALAELRLVWPARPLMAVESKATGRGGFSRLPTAVQQNVPAWALFGMFFSLIPLAVSLIRERASGVMLRLKILPVPYAAQMAGKLAAYFLVCVAQFGLILLLGRYLMPVLGLPALEMGRAHGALLLVVGAASLAAAGAGVFLGVAARSQTQASTIGALAVVIAAALGGVMVPVFAMPPFMQTLSRLSPLAWGLEAILDLFVRNGSLATIWPQVLGLAGFAAASLAGAGWIARRRQ